MVEIEFMLAATGFWTATLVVGKARVILAYDLEDVIACKRLLDTLVPELVAAGISVAFSWSGAATV